ncbi:MAG: guanylate kinase, partial [Steroidobacteraceae bacterium]
MQREPELRFSVSYTTRKPRPNEKPGHDYFFVDKNEFERMIAADAFLEHACVFDNRYGTSRSQVEGLLEQGANVLLEIDWQGAQQVRNAMPECESIFILPPSRTALEARLRGRATDTDEVIARRLRDSIDDMSHWNEFKYVVVNDQFERALEDLVLIIKGRGSHLAAQRSEVQQLVRQLLQ